MKYLRCLNLSLCWISSILAAESTNLDPAGMDYMRRTKQILLNYSTYKDEKSSQWRRNALLEQKFEKEFHKRER